MLKMSGPVIITLSISTKTNNFTLGDSTTMANLVSATKIISAFQKK